MVIGYLIYGVVYIKYAYTMNIHRSDYEINICYIVYDLL